MTAPFRLPPGTNELIREHLVSSAEIARRTGVSRASVANWLTRHPDFTALAIPLSGNGFAFWWPQVQTCLTELGLPRAAPKRSGRAPKRPRIVCPICARDVQKRSDGTPRTHYPPPDRPDLACGDAGSHCCGSHIEAGS